MRFMIIVQANKDSEAGIMPSNEVIEAMGKFNEELIAAGALVTAEGLMASNRGARVKFQNGKFAVIDGPFSETKELVAGFWIVDVKSKEEAIEWVKKIPFEDGETVEIRKVFEASDWEDGLVSAEAIEKEKTLRAAADKPRA